MSNCSICGKVLPDDWLTDICAQCALKEFTSKEFKTIDTSFVVADDEDEIIKKYGEIYVTFLAGLVKDNFVVTKILNEGFKPSFLQHQPLIKIADLILYLHQQGKKADKLLLIEYLKKEGIYDSEYDKIINYIFSMQAPDLAGMLEYLNFLKEQDVLNQLKHLKRQIDDFVSGRIAKSTTLEFVNNLVRQLRQLQSTRTGKDVKVIKSQLIQIANEIQDRQKHGEIECLGYSIQPYNDLNLALSGFRKGFFYAIAGAPRRGKTSLTLELATTVARNNKVPVIFISWEQTRRTLTYRILAKESRINTDTLQRKNIMKDPELMKRFAAGWKKMEEYMDYFYLVEGSKKDTVDRIKAYAYNVMEEMGTDEVIIFLDYLQKMPYPNQYSNEKFKIEEISTDIKRLTIELNCPILVISSLTREGCELDAAPGRGRPTMYHCKGSGDIEYDLDVAMILAKDWDDTKELENQLRIKAKELGKDPERVPKIDIVNLYLDKNRDAPEGMPQVVQFFFFIEENKYIELGFKYEEDPHRYSRIDKLLNKLIDTGLIKFRDKQELTESKLNLGKARRIKLKRDF